MEDRRCKLGLLGRHELVLLVEQGSTPRQAAACLRVAPATAHRWWHRWRVASDQRTPITFGVISGGMKADDVKRLKELERENQRLKRIVANQALDIDGLKEIARGNF